MKKEVILAIIAGTLMGLVVAVGMWRARSSTNNQENQNTVLEQISQNLSVSSPGDIELAVTSHQSNSVITESTITLEGIASPGSWIAISAEDNQVIEAENNGSFKADVELSSGINQILITAFSSNGNSKKQERLVLVYSSEYQEETNEE